MSLTLRIQSWRKQAPETPVERRFDRLGGTIGRAPGNDLELPDPGKYVSRTHCKVDFVDGRYTLVDLGSNPSWVNDHPLGAGKSAVLAHGDLVAIGDYVLEVAVDEARAAEPVPLFEPDYSPAHPFQAQPAAAVQQPAPAYLNANDSLSGAKILDSVAETADNDPLGLNLFGSAHAAPDPLAFRGSEFDHVAPQFVAMGAADPVVVDVVPVPPVPAPVAAPRAPVLIPDDYDPLADFLPPRLDAQPAPAAAPAPPVPPAQDGEVLQALLRGLGLPGLAPNRTPAETAELVGAMLREATAGTMAVLMARAMTKRESRLELTVIGAQANNPLKFMPDADSALSQMLTNAMAGYMPPLKAFASAFEDLKAHEMAVIAGMQAALAGVLARFDPAAIEEWMAPEGVMDKVLATSRKAKMWDRMVELFGEVSRESQDDFQRLFGERFTAAYEDQVGRLRQGQRNED